MSLDFVPLITVLTLLLFFGVSLNVGLARGKYNIQVPATSGHPKFDISYRIQMNTLEATVLFLPALWLFSWYVSNRWAAILGAAWLLGRVVYVVGYTLDPKKRAPGFLIAIFSTITLIVGALVGIVVQVL